MSNKNRFRSSTRVYTSDDTLNFGKYSGKRIEEVLNLDPEYLFWCQCNITWFKLEHELYEQVVSSTLKNKISRYVKDSPYWFEDDNGSWLS